MKEYLFIRKHCPNCPPVKEYTGQRFPDAEIIDCDTEEGMEQARGRWILSTPTLVVCNDEGEEQWRASSVEEIKAKEKDMEDKE